MMFEMQRKILHRPYKLINTPNYYECINFLIGFAEVDHMNSSVLYQ